MYDVSSCRLECLESLECLERKRKLMWQSVIVPDWIVIAILTLDAGLARSGSMKLQQSNQEAIQQVAPFEA